VDKKTVILGTVTGVFGIRGWVKVASETEIPSDILNYQTWQLQFSNGSWHSYTPITGKIHGKGLIVQLKDCSDRNQAATLIGCKIAVYREQLPVLEAESFYWADLEGLQVLNQEGTNLGTISHLFDSVANEVLVVIGERERLIPFLWDKVIKHVDLANGKMLVDWDSAF
jgi:16S rRNA processing protein RimM